MRIPDGLTGTLLLCLLATLAPAQDARDRQLQGRERVVHALARLTFGVTGELVDEVEAMGLAPWIERQLEHDEMDDDLISKLADYRSLGLTAREIYEEYVEAEVDQAAKRRAVGTELLGSILIRASENDWQIAEVMTDFWRNHFNVDRSKDSVRYTATDYEHEVIRRFVFGRFEDMLMSSAKHPAMLVYLDNHISRRRPTRTELKTVARRVRQRTGSRRRGEEAAQIAAQTGLNENYARELLELHTLGVDNGYEQKDVIALAEALTGWTVDRRKWAFQYRDDMHEHGAKFILGRAIPRTKRRNGMTEAEKVIRMLAGHRSTSGFLARKMCAYLVADDPPESLVKSTAAALRKSGFDLREAVRHIATSDEFYDRAHYRAKFKTPLEFVVSALRVTGAEVSDPSRLFGIMTDMGQPLYRCEDPTGYRDVAESWRDPGVMALRWKFAMDLAHGRIRGIEIPDSFFEGLQVGNTAALVAGLGRKVLPGGMRSDTIRVLMRVARRYREELEEERIEREEEELMKRKSGGGKPRRRDRPRPPVERKLLGVILGSPEFQEQ